MTPRDGNTDELKIGSYFVSKATQEILRVDAVTATDFHLTNAQGVTRTMPRPWEPKPITIMEPTHDEAMAAVTTILGAEPVAEKTSEGWRVAPCGNVAAKWHTHMFLMHGIWTKTGPGSRSLDKIKAAHALDHEDAAEGTPTGAYVAHRHHERELPSS